MTNATLRLEGAMTALCTPFRDGAIDVPALEALVEAQIKGGIDALVPAGTTGESATLTLEEQVRVVEIVVKVTRGRVPVVAGAGSNATAHAIALGRAVKAAGADAMLQVVPYYNKPSQEGLFRHFSAIVEAVHLPTVLYNVPGRTGCDLSLETIERLCELPEVIALKDATGSVPRATQTVARLGERLTVLSGDDAVNYPLYSVGARGCISVVSTVAPQLVAEAWDAHAAGDSARARAAHVAILPLCEALFWEGNPIPVKWALHLMGRMGPEIRLPLVPLATSYRERLHAVLAGDEARVMTKFEARMNREKRGGGVSSSFARRGGREGPPVVNADGKLRIVVPGAMGRMGQMVLRAVAEASDLELVAAVERPQSSLLGQEVGSLVGVPDLHIPLVKDFDGALDNADVIIDFTAPAATAWMATRAAEHDVAMVIGTTGLGEAELTAVQRASERVPIVLSANMSLGVNVLLGLVEQAAASLGPDYDVEILELHHRQKRDAPSGTALTLLDTAAHALNRDPLVVARFGRHGGQTLRTPEEIGVLAVRGGDTVGEHTVFFSGIGERIELTHRASSRETFARGAIRAARWLTERDPGLYDMKDVLGLRR